jgi:hypothetical protein
MAESTCSFSPLKVGCLGGIQLLIERQNLASLDLGPGDGAQPVACMQLAAAAVVDRGQILHLAGMLFADVAQVQAQHGVTLHPPARHGRQLRSQFRFQRKRGGFLSINGMVRRLCLKELLGV